MGKIEDNKHRKKLDDFPACIPKILNECQHSYALHPRRIKELVALRREHREDFMKEWWQTLRPVFLVTKREPAVERIVKFVGAFSAYRDEKQGDECDAFLEEFFGILLYSSDASHKAVRFRACQILSEVIMRLPDNAEVSNEVWDEVIGCMQRRMQDKVPIVRVYAVRALARFANDTENANIVDLYKQALASEQNAEVRKMLVLSMPPSNATAADIIERTLDVNDSVRKVAYRVLANKFPLQSLSIKLRTTILRRGLADRVPAVTAECVKMMKDAWLTKCCAGDSMALLKYLDVETNESVGEAVMRELLKAGMIHIKEGQSLRQFLAVENESKDDPTFQRVCLMEAETALYWRILCSHLQSEAQEKGSDAATTQGAEAAVYAAAAADKNELLDRVLPATVADYVELVEAHLLAGTNYRFVTRQLLLLGLMLDFSDAANRKVASSFLQKLLHRPIEHAIDEEDGKVVVIGDGVNLGGDKEWARAVTELARKIHASSGEFEEVVANVVAELGQPCREGGADFMQWMHCLAVTGLTLENIKSFRDLQGKAIEASEILHGLLLPAAKHIHIEVSRAATRCLGIFGLREKKPSEPLVRQLRLAFCNGPSQVRMMAAKALFDLCMWHGAGVVDGAINIGAGLGPAPQACGLGAQPPTAAAVETLDGDEGDTDLMLLDLLSSGLDRDDWDEHGDMGDTETVRGVLAEGFAKLLLQSKLYSDVLPMQASLLAKLICLYFSEETKDLHRLRQCLSVFFDQYPALSAEHKKCISKAFIPVMRSVWPGVYGNPGGSSNVVASLRKHATQISRFMVQLLHTPLYNVQEESIETESTQHSAREDDGQEVSTSKEMSSEVDAGLEELAIRIGVEVASYPSKKTAAGKSYIAALCKVAVLLDFRSSEQDAIKCMRKLLNYMADFVSGDKQVVKELEGMMVRLKSLDANPDEGLSDDQMKFILGNLGLDKSIDFGSFVEDSVSTPAPVTKRATTRRRPKRTASPDSTSPVNLAPVTPCTTRSQRVSKTAALGKMRCKTLDLVEVTDEIDEEELRLISKTTSEEESDSTDSEFVVEREEVDGTTGKKGLSQHTRSDNISDNDESQNENDGGTLAKPLTCKKKSFKSKEASSFWQTAKKPPRPALVAYEEEGDSDFEARPKAKDRSSYKSVSKRTVPKSTKAQLKKQSENLGQVIDGASEADSGEEGNS